MESEILYSVSELRICTRLISSKYCMCAEQLLWRTSVRMVELVCVAPISCERRGNLVLGVGGGSSWRPDALGAAMLEQLFASEASTSTGDGDAGEASAPAPATTRAAGDGSGGGGWMDAPLNSLLLEAATASELHESARVALSSTHLEVLRHALNSLKLFFSANGSGLKAGFMDTSTQMRAVKQMLSLYAQSSDSLFRAFTFSQSLLGALCCQLQSNASWCSTEFNISGYHLFCLREIDANQNHFSNVLSIEYSVKCSARSCARRQPGDRPDGKGVARDRLQSHDGARPDPQCEGYSSCPFRRIAYPNIPVQTRAYRY